VASHFGGSLTHGSDYLTRYAPAPLRHLLGGKSEPAALASKPANPAQMKVFADIMQPLLRQDCVPCHGPDKSKGKLRLDSFDAILKGGESGPAIVPGKSGESIVMKRLLLPSGHEDHMPPEGKPQPTADELALLQWWINAGAPKDSTFADLKPPASVARILDARFGSALATARLNPPRPLSELLPLASSLAEDLGISITALSSKDPWLQCNASVAGTNFGDAELGKLKPLGSNLRWLDLGGTRVTDAGLAHLAIMPNLTRLHLERTSITDAGLSRLVDLPNLEYLNLYGDDLTDAVVEVLRQLPKLKQVYLWQTKVSPTAAKALAEARTDVAQIRVWNEEIEALRKKVTEAHFSAELGVTANNASGTNAPAVNTQCPVSGKPADPAKTVLYEGKLVAFCCDDCKAKFQQDPKPFLEKLSSTANKSP
jgi:YHS domain-containing protein